MACFRLGDQRGLKGEVLVKLRPKRGEGISHMKNWGKSVGTERTARTKGWGIHGRGGAGNSPWIPFTVSTGHWLSPFMGCHWLLLRVLGPHENSPQLGI